MFKTKEETMSEKSKKIKAEDLVPMYLLHGRSDRDEKQKIDDADYKKANKYIWPYEEQWLESVPQADNVVVQDFKEGDMLYGTSGAITAVQSKLEHSTTNSRELTRRNEFNALLAGGKFNDEFKGNKIYEAYYKKVSGLKNLFGRNTFYGSMKGGNLEARKGLMSSKEIKNVGGGYNAADNSVREAFKRASKQGIYEVVRSGKGRIFYMLDGINIADVVGDRTTREGGSIVSSEIRYLYRRHLDGDPLTNIFWTLQGKYVVPPWEGHKSKLWDDYTNHLEKKWGLAEK
ncbi:hypothetical protein [Chromobacterium phragmitis]|uniref:Uncharacterized protein n=1 Tax=Chromobacterium phragmitis TaxID=2202141 RepID=A0ABV0J204_9NEIS